MDGDAGVGGLGMVEIRLGPNGSDTICSPRRCYRPLQVNIQGLEENLLPFLELNPREKSGFGSPRSTPAAAGGCWWEGALAVGWHRGCCTRASSAGTQGAQGSWEQNRNVRVTQRFLAGAQLVPPSRAQERRTSGQGPSGGGSSALLACRSAASLCLLT